MNTFTFIVEYNTIPMWPIMPMFIDAINAEDAVKACKAAHPDCFIASVRLANEMNNMQEEADA